MEKESFEYLKMANRVRDIFIPTAAILATLVAAGLSAWISVTMNAAGPIPLKGLTSDFAGPTDPIDDLVGTGANLTVSIKSDSGTLNKVYLYRASLSNSGAAPILPSDFFGEIKLIAQPPWSIVAIGRSTIPGPRQVPETWTRISDTEYDARPTLLNSGDELAATVYLTAPDAIAKAVHFDDPPPISWLVRVANLPYVTVAPNTLEQMRSEMGPIFVHVWGWGIPFLLMAFVLYFALVIFLAFRSGLPSKPRHLAASCTVMLALISLAAAEATNTYVFGVVPGFRTPVDDWVNAPPILAWVVCVIGLYAIDIRRAYSADKKAAVGNGR